MAACSSLFSCGIKLASDGTMSILVICCGEGELVLCEATLVPTLTSSTFSLKMLSFFKNLTTSVRNSKLCRFSSRHSCCKMDFLTILKGVGK